MYQAQKALDNAKHAVKDGGVIIWVASCTEGFGEGVFEEWINEAESPHSLVERIQRQFQLGGHKAAAIAMVLERCDVFLVSDLDERIVRKAFLTPYRDIDKALQDAYAKLGEQAKVLIMPYGGSTLPVLE
jgi:nickel-dependent lactate racemase